MQFLILGYDGKDPDALNRRLAVRDAHLTLAEKKHQSGNLLYAVALLDEQGKMCGSMLVVEYPSRQALDQYLQIEPYITGKVWEKVEIIPCKIGPTFTK
jgi:uncharacterized protein YciI